MDHHRTLTVGELFPEVGAPVHANHLPHQANTFFHDHDFLEVAIVDRGHGVHRNLHGTLPLHPGDVILVTPGQWHGYEACRDLWLYNLGVAHSLLINELAWLNHDPTLSSLLFQRRAGKHAPDQRIVVGRLDSDVRKTVFTAINDIIALQATGDHLRVRAEVIGHLCIALGTIARHLPPQHISINKIDDGIRDLIVAMEGRLEHPWGLAELSRRLQVTPAYCVRRFRRAMGIAPLGWLTRRRTEAAAVLLVTTDASITEIARSVGWSDANYFARRFRSIFGENPSAYRLNGPQAMIPSRTSMEFANSDSKSPRS